MKKSALLILTFFIFTSSAFAESKATVKVDNNVSGSSTSNVQSHTNITVETNGQTTTYSSDKPGSIEVNSVNGKTEIKENGVVVSSSPTNKPTSPSTAPTDQPEDDSEDKNRQNPKNIFDIFEDIFKTIFSLLV